MNYGSAPSHIFAFHFNIPFDFSESNMSVELSRKSGIYSTHNNQLVEVNIRFRIIRYSYRLSIRNRKVSSAFRAPSHIIAFHSDIIALRKCPRAPSHIIVFHSDIIILQKTILLTNSLIEYILSAPIFTSYCFPVLLSVLLIVVCKAFNCDMLAE